MKFDFLHSGAKFSPCRRYRYALERIWDPGKALIMFICLNPSTADETNNDPTVRRCLGFARDWGAGGLILANIFAYRATDRRVMQAQDDPVGPENDKYLWFLAQRGSLVVAAWGNLGLHRQRHRRVLELCPHLNCLGVNQSGQPKHPLYLRRDAQLVPYP